MVPHVEKYVNIHSTIIFTVARWLEQKYSPYLAKKVMGLSGGLNQYGS